MKMLRKKGWLALLAAVALIGFVSQAQATPLAPGGLAIGPFTPASLAGEPVLASASGTFSNGPVSGEFRTAVLKFADGTLDFAYQFKVTSGDVQNVSVFNFKGFSTDLYTTLTGPGTAGD